MGLILGIFLVVLGICVTVMAIQLCRGKWYRIIAGNNQADKKIIEEQKKQRLGLGVGIVLFIAAFMVFFAAGYILSQLNIWFRYIFFAAKNTRQDR